MTKTKSTLLASDGEIDINVGNLAAQLNRVCTHIKFAVGPDVRLENPISCPTTYNRIEAFTKPLIADHSSLFIATEFPYDNNYFWEVHKREIITSFFGWNLLTNLPKNNGFVGFVYSLLALDLNPNSSRHFENTGCVFDYMLDKRGVDARLRAGMICRDCYDEIQVRATNEPVERLKWFDCTVEEGLHDLMTLLDEVAQASKREIDVMDRWRPKAGVPQTFDVFLCHNSDDKPSVRSLYTELVQRGLCPWFDEEHLRPGIPWQRELETAIPSIKAAAVIVGPNGRGPWQDFELDAFPREFIRQGNAVIPVLLADAGDTPTLPLFLQAFTWVDFRKRTPDPWRQLMWGITGVKPGS